MEGGGGFVVGTSLVVEDPPTATLPRRGGREGRAGRLGRDRLESVRGGLREGGVRAEVSMGGSIQPSGSTHPGG